MLRLIKYLKPYVIYIILIFALLYVQATTDLALPSYMSDIVNTGIQSNGISEKIPTAIRLGELNKLKLLLSDSVAAQVDQIYQVLDKGQLSAADYATWVAKYPLLASESIAVLVKDAQPSDALTQGFSKALAVKAAIDSGLAGGSGMGNIPPGMDLFDVLAMMTTEQRQQVLSQIDEKMAGLSGNMLEAYASTAINAEYKAIGLDIKAIQNRFMFNTGGLMLLIALLGAVSSILVGLLASRVAAGVSRDLRRSVFSKVEHFSSAEFDNFSTASLITRTTNDIQQIQMTLVMLLRILFYAPILGIGGILKVIRSDASMAWIIAVAVAALMTLIITIFIIALPRFKMIQKLVDRLNLVTREILTGLMVIRAFNTQGWQEKKFDTANRDITKIGLFISRVMAMLMPTMMLIMNGVSLLIVWVGAHQVDAGNMQVGDVMAFIQYTMQIIMAFLMVSMVFIMLPRASVSGQRIAEVLAVKPIIVDKAEPVRFAPSSQGRIEFRDVGFQYPNADDPVLCSISFIAQPGQTTAFIGSTGCGKSTLVNLIPRFYDATSGQILIDGIDVRDVTQHDLRQRIGYVSQKGILFTGDIRANIAYGKPDATDEEIQAAAAVAQALDFIDASDQKFETPIAQGGANVSGGQKQRLAIARALVKKPDIYIFDDTFSALDYKTDAALRKALHQTTGGSTVLIVAQRIGTILHADQIVVLDEGVIVGIGTHSELMASCAVYQEIASSQLSEEELAL
jgi:ATP-binding cassette, subfamily B, multidrug efflux pump